MAASIKGDGSPAPNRAARDDKTPVSFLDTNWSWSSPSSWPLSVRFLPFPIAFIVLFFGVYIQYFLSPSASPMDSCIRDFDYGVPIPNVEKLATDLATHDWEQGTAAEALLELHNPELSIFSPNPFPRHNIPCEGVREAKALQFVLPKTQLHNQVLSSNTWGVSDPASLGVFTVLAAAATENESPNTPYKSAAQRQADFLLNEAPRYENGAISHRREVAELWSDAMFMFPPFVAYWAIIAGEAGGTRTMKQAVEQIGLYRDVLMITEGERKGAWRHIVGPSEMADPGAWSTGNAWALYGMARVRATLAGWTPGASLLREQIASLDRWMAEIVGAAIRTDDDESGLLRNYLGETSWFGDTAGTALIAAGAYRLASFLESTAEREKVLAWAERKRKAVFAHVDAEGVAKPAVNSLKHAQRQPLDGRNPEGESFLLLLAAAWRDCICRGVCSR